MLGLCSFCQTFWKTSKLQLKWKTAGGQNSCWANKQIRPLQCNAGLGFRSLSRSLNNFVWLELVFNPVGRLYLPHNICVDWSKTFDSTFPCIKCISSTYKLDYIRYLIVWDLRVMKSNESIVVIIFWFVFMLIVGPVDWTAYIDLKLSQSRNTKMDFFTIGVQNTEQDMCNLLSMDWILETPP